MTVNPILQNLLAELRMGRFRPRAIRKFVTYGVRHAVNLAWTLKDLRRSFYVASAGMAAVLLVIGLLLELVLPDGLGRRAWVAEAVLFGVVFGLTLLQLGLVRAENTGEVYDRFVFPNVLTLLRLLVIPYAVAAMAAGTDGNAAVAAFGVLGFAVLSDTLDGTLSRRLGLTSDFGRIYDPVVDVCFHSTLAVTLYALGHVTTAYLVVVLLRYLLPPVAGVFLILSGAPFQVKSTVMGKVSSFVLSLFVCLLWGGKALQARALVEWSIRVLEPVCIAVCAATVLFFLGWGFRIVRRKPRTD